MKRKLSVLAAAADQLALNKHVFSCNAVEGEDPSLKKWYFDCLLKLGAIQLRFNLVNFSSPTFYYMEGREERLTFMAWLITMVKEGEVK